MWLPVGNLVIGACRSAAFASLLLLLWQLSSGLPEGLLLRGEYSFVVEKQHLSDGILVVKANMNS